MNRREFPVHGRTVDDSEPTDYPGNAVHQNLSVVLLSFTFPPVVISSAFFSLVFGVDGSRWDYPLASHFCSGYTSRGKKSPDASRILTVEVCIFSNGKIVSHMSLYCTGPCKCQHDCRCECAAPSAGRGYHSCAERCAAMRGLSERDISLFPDAFRFCLSDELSASVFCQGFHLSLKNGPNLRERRID